MLAVHRQRAQFQPWEIKLADFPRPWYLHHYLHAIPITPLTIRARPDKPVAARTVVAAVIQIILRSSRLVMQYKPQLQAIAHPDKTCTVTVRRARVMQNDRELQVRVRQRE